MIPAGDDGAGAQRELERLVAAPGGNRRPSSTSRRRHVLHRRLVPRLDRRSGPDDQVLGLELGRWRTRRDRDGRLDADGAGRRRVGDGPDTQRSGGGGCRNRRGGGARRQLPQAASPRPDAVRATRVRYGGGSCQGSFRDGSVRGPMRHRPGGNGSRPLRHGGVRLPLAGPLFQWGGPRYTPLRPWAMLLDRLAQVTTTLRSSVTGLDPETLSGADAARLLAAFAEIERLASAGKLLSARRGGVVQRLAAVRPPFGRRPCGRGHRHGDRSGHQRARDGPPARLPARHRRGRASGQAVRGPGEGDRRRRHPPARGRASRWSKRPHSSRLSVLKLRCKRVRATGQEPAGHL